MAPMILSLLRAWVLGRAPDESFQAWSARHDEAALRGFLAAEAVAA
jgi:hypothetical protein